MQLRFKLLTGFFLTSFALIFFRLIYWQIINQGSLSSIADRQHQSSRLITAPRGQIFASDLYPLATNITSYLLIANPSTLQVSKADLTQQLAKILPDLSLDTNYSEDKKVYWYPLVKDISPSQKTAISQLKLQGLFFEEVSSRSYPEASMAASLLGFVGQDKSGLPTGYFGLEGYYNQDLVGQNGQLFLENDALGRPIPLGEQVEEKAIPGRNLVLSLDRSIQFHLEEHLKSGVAKYRAESALGIVMNPVNGQILAMANYPTFDPASYNQFQQEDYRNPVVSDGFEPGSIFKIFVMAAGLETKTITENEVCTFCFGPKTIADYTIRTWNDKYYPNSSMTDVLVHSDNVGMVYVMTKLGKANFINYFDQFGFTQKTKIDLQGEVVPVTRNLSDWRDIDLATASFGQGIAVTPIQILTAAAALANGGKISVPSLVQKVVDGERTIATKPISRQVLSPETIRILTQMMVAAVDRGEAKWAKPKGYQIAGKTGTAQIPIAGHYDATKTIASFVGFAPADKPRFVMLITLREPKTSPWGSETAAPLWFDVAKDIFRILAIRPQD